MKSSLSLFSFALAAYLLITASSCNSHATMAEHNEKYPPFTCDSLYAFLNKKLNDRCSGYDYKNPVVKIETCQMGKPISYVGSSERLAYPCTYTWMQQYDDYNSRRIEHIKGDYSVFARNIDNGKWEIIQGKNGEKSVDTKYFKQ